MDNFELWYRFNSNRKTQGSSPLTFAANGEPLKNWTIDGRTSPNIFDVSAVLLDSALDENGDVIVQDGSSVSDYISINTSEGLWFSGDLQQGGTSLSRMMWFTYYDNNKAKISTGVIGWPNSGRVTYEFTQIPVTASYIRIQYSTEQWNDIMMNAGSAALPYETYGRVGEKTENLFSENYNKTIADNVIEYIPMFVGNGIFTLSTDCPKGPETTNNANTSRCIFFLPGNVSTGAQNAVNGVSVNAPRTITAVNGYVTVAYRKMESANLIPWEHHTILNEGSTLLPYEPYGYKISVTSGGVTTNIYLDHPLGDGESISMADTGIAIPTINGENILSVDTAVSPSNVSIAASRIPKNTEAYFRYKYDVLRKRDY